LFSSEPDCRFADTHKPRSLISIDLRCAARLRTSLYRFEGLQPATIALRKHGLQRLCQRQPLPKFSLILNT
jgi:hypothetical protein